VADWVSDIRNILDPIAEYYRGSIEWVMPADDEARWNTDQMRLTQIALNLCENALKFSVGVAEPVRMSIDIDQDMLRIAVEDSGPGIPPAKQASVFGAFSQADSKVSPLDEGVGLGLSVVKINVELLGGEVAVENLRPSGTKFTVLCPLLQPRADSSKSNHVIVDLSH
jgi:signal transduction histidine kinase